MGKACILDIPLKAWERKTVSDLCMFAAFIKCQCYQLTWGNTAFGIEFQTQSSCVCLNSIIWTETAIRIFILALNCSLKTWTLKSHSTQITFMLKPPFCGDIAGFVWANKEYREAFWTTTIRFKLKYLQNDVVIQYNVWGGKKQGVNWCNVALSC